VVMDSGLRPSAGPGMTVLPRCLDQSLSVRSATGILLASGTLILSVIPGRAEGASPESITPGGAVVYYVYILASRKHGTLYIGVTNDLVRRIHEHKTDAVPGFTSRYGVHLLVWFERYDDVLSAVAREKEIKKWHREWEINLIERSNPEWVDLYPGIAN